MYWNLAQRACAHPHRALVLPIALATVLATAPFAVIAQPRDATESIKFALFSAAWGENTDDGVRVVAQNQTEQAVTLERIRFLNLPEEGSHVDLRALA